jgi:bacteriocin-like protein
MKKLVFATALDLGKEIIANLSDEQLQQIEGGIGVSDSGTPSCTGQTSGTSCSKEATVEAGN